MSLETASYISGLNAANPPAGDPVGQADDHLRLVKGVLKNTFPNLDAPVTLTPSQLNTPVPKGSMMFWLSATQPDGWVICDGRTYEDADGVEHTAPDLRNKFFIGASDSAPLGVTGGAATHSHTGSVGGTILTQAQMPLHAHTVTDPGHAHTYADGGHAHTYSAFTTSAGSGNGLYSPSTQLPGGVTTATSTVGVGITIQAANTGVTIVGNGGDQAHDHPLTINPGSNYPPFVAVNLIMKI